MKGGGGGVVFLDIAEINVYNTLERNKNKKTPGGGFLPWTGGPVYIL